MVSPPDFVVNTWSRSSDWAVWAPDPDSVSSCKEVLFSTLGSQVLLFVYVWACVQSARHMLTAVTLWLMITWAMYTNHTVALYANTHYQDFCSITLEVSAISPAFFYSHTGLSACESGLLSWWSASVHRAAFSSGVMSNWANCWSKLWSHCVLEAG